MKIHATFAQLDYGDLGSDCIVELAHAWDEYCVDGNYDGYVASRQKALDSYGKDLLQHVDVEIEVPIAQVEERLRPLQIEAEKLDVTRAPDVLDGP